jgi:hypothetical protein
MMSKRATLDKLASLVEELQSVDGDKKETTEKVDIRALLDSIYEEDHVFEACLQGGITRISESIDEGVANGIQLQWCRFKKLIDQLTDVLWAQERKNYSDK